MTCFDCDNLSLCPIIEEEALNSSVKTILNQKGRRTPEFEDFIFSYYCEDCPDFEPMVTEPNFD